MPPACELPRTLRLSPQKPARIDAHDLLQATYSAVQSGARFSLKAANPPGVAVRAMLASMNCVFSALSVDISRILAPAFRAGCP